MFSVLSLHGFLVILYLAALRDKIWSYMIHISAIDIAIRLPQTLTTPEKLQNIKIKQVYAI